MSHNDLIAALAMPQDTDQVAHGAGRDEQRCFFSQQVGGHGFQTVDRGILAVNVISDLRAGMASRMAGVG